MASLIPDIGSVSTNTTGAMQNYLGTVKATNDALEKPADILNAHVKNMLEQKRLDQDMALKREANARANTELGMQQEKFGRETNEYNRELGLRDVRKTLAAEYEANPYAYVWGGGAQNKLLDKQVLDYVNSGGVIDADKATALQKMYETTRPFKEDLAQSFKSRLLAAGEDPTKADAYAKSMTDSMPFSRANLQSQLDKQQEIQQGYYNAVAAANKDVAKMRFDVAKANQEASVDQAKLDLDYKKLMFGNTTGGSGGGTNADGDKVTAGGAGGLSQLLSGIGWSDAKGAKQNVDTWLKAGYSDRQIFNAVKNAIDDDSTAILLKDRTLNTDAVNRQLATMDKGETLTSGKGKVEPITSNVNAKDLLAQFAPRQIAGYDPESVLAKAKADLPWLNSDSNVPTGQPVTSKEGSYENTVKKIESSGGKYDAVNKDSGAMGAYQFLPSTLNDYRKRNGNFTNEEFAKNPELQDKVFNQFTLDNENKLRNRGIEVNDYTKWIAHNLGAGNVKDFVEGKETPGLLKAISAQFGGKPSGINEYNAHFGKYFTGERKADVNKNTKELSTMFDAKPPVSTEGDVNSRYDKLSSFIEPTISKDTVLTQDKKEELLAKYEPVLSKVMDDVAKNGDGIFGRKRYFDTLVADKITKNGVSKTDRDWANSVIDELLAGNAPTDYDPTRVGGVGNRKPTVKEQFELATSPKGNSDPVSMFLDRYNPDNTKSVEQHRQSLIANKYVTDPSSLSKEEIRWIEGNRQTPNGRLLLDSLGIK